MLVNDTQHATQQSCARHNGLSKVAHMTTVAIHALNEVQNFLNF